LVIVPDAQLYLIPFAVLPTEPDGQHFLVEKYANSLIYSGSLLQINKARRAPEYNNSLAFAPFHGFEAGDTDRRGSNLGALPYSLKEISAMGLKYVGENGKKDIFLEQASGKPIIHLATHAAIDSSLNSPFIAFHPEGSHVSNKLYLHELGNIDLSATNLMIVNACKAGWGKITPGEGVISLGRAMSKSGVTNVLMNIWDANDRATAEVISRFHKYYKRGYDEAVALQKAQIEYLHHVKNNQVAARHQPQLWGNFCLVGEVGMNSSHTFWLQSPRSTLILALLTTLIVSAILFGRKVIGHS
jgi:CHAT domain-containing protein